MSASPTEAYGKDEDDERFLSELNETLAGPEAVGYAELPERDPTVHVLGLPRSGTTLALQLIAAHTSIAYIDHITAAFPRAPVTGLRLSRKLRRGLPHASSFQSDFGRTAELTEPHEFTYFWSDLFGLPTGLAGLTQPAEDHAVDWPRARRVLTNLCAAAGGPVAFKSFHVIWQLRALCAALPRTVVVCVQRDHLEVGLSLLRMRETLYGSREAWASIRPAEYAWLRDADWPTQIAGQMLYTARALERGLPAVAAGGLVTVAYRDMCRDPAGFLDQVVDAVATLGGRAQRIGTAPEPFRLSDRPRPESEDARLLRIAIDELGALC